MTSTYTSSASDDDDVITHLKFYSQLKEGEKIESSNPLSVSYDNIFSNFMRTISFSSNRFENLSNIKTVVGKTLEIVEKHIQHNEFHQLPIEYILTDLNLLVSLGLKNLSKTYESDRMFNVSITKFIENINSSIYKIMVKSDSIRNFIKKSELFKEVKLPILQTIKEVADDIKDIKQAEVSMKVISSVEKMELEVKPEKKKEENPIIEKPIQEAVPEIVSTRNL